MANTHEYTFFDRARVDDALAMKWSVLDESYPGWGQWEDARAFLLDWALDDVSGDEVDRLVATTTVRATLHLSSDPFSFLRGLLDAKSLAAGGAEIPKGEYEYANQIVSCAVAAFQRGALSLAGLNAIYRLHANYVPVEEVFSEEVAQMVLSQPEPPLMLPGLPDATPETGDALGIVQTRRFIDFLQRAWREKWPLTTETQARGRQTIRACEVAGDLVASLRRQRMKKPCVYRWFEC